jgi:hypothetical protein
MTSRHACGFFNGMLVDFLSFSSTLQIILKAANHITEINEQLHNIARDEGQFANLHI